MLSVFKKDKDKFGIYSVKQAIKDKSANKLQPKKKVPVENKGSNCSTWAEWATAVAYYKTLFLTMLDAPAPKKNGTVRKSMKIKDLKQRAKEIASKLKPFHTTIRLMDGHGRFVLMLMSQIIKQHGIDRANAIKIELVDIDPKVHAYHKSFYPKSLIDQNKLVLLCQDVTTLPLDANTLVYLNFCGISASQEKVKELLKQATTDPSVCVVVSWSVARGWNKNILLSFNIAVGINFSLQLVETGRSDFKTYILVKK